MATRTAKNSPGGATKPIRVKLYAPHSGQMVLHRSQARFRVVTCGRRWGKTLGSQNELAKFVLDNPKKLGWFVGPTYKQVRKPYRMIRQALAPLISREIKSELRIELINGSAIEFRSAENYDALRGEGVDFMVIDEASMIARQAWEEVLRPMLSDTNGKAIFISTPKGRNYFFELHSRGYDSEFDEWESFIFPTSSNPYIAPKEILEAEKTLPSDVFRQEYLAEFLEDSAGVFRNIRGCINGTFEPPRRGGVYVIGWDVAKHKDFSVLTCMDVTRRHVVAFERFNLIDYSLQLARVKLMVQQYRASVLMDSTGVGDPLLEQVRKLARGRAYGYTLTNTSKQQLIENLAVGIEKGSLSFPEIPPLISELQLFQYEMTRAGNVRYNAPAGFHDDTVISLGLAFWACKRGKMTIGNKPTGY